MPVVLFVLIKLVVEAIRSALRKTRPVKPQPLCAGCSNAHVQYGAEGRRAISCTFGGMVRPCHVGRVVLHRLPRPQSQHSLSADRVCTGGPGQPSRSVEMLPERLSAPLARAFGQTASREVCRVSEAGYGGTLSPRPPASSRSYRFGECRCYGPTSRLGRDRAGRHFLGLLGLARVRRFLGLAESGPEDRLRFRTGVFRELGQIAD